MSSPIFILGANGFIGSHLVEHILKNTDWEIVGLDLSSDKLGDLIQHERFAFHQRDMLQSYDWIEQQIQRCSTVLPLAAIANPQVYVKDPLRIFELDFEANLSIVRLCVKHKKRVIFPSTSEVYGMCPDAEFDEETSNFVLGPINKPRWIYSCAKQMMDRVIAAYADREGLRYTLFRPFNWMGPKLDNILDLNAGSSRAFSQFIGNVLRGQSITLVNGGTQRRSFTYIDDGISALIKIIANENGCAENRIFNIGNPKNDISMRELAELIITEIKKYPKYAENAAKVQLITASADEYFGKGYQDVGARVPSIKHAAEYLGWQPVVDVATGLRKTLEFYLG